MHEEDGFYRFFAYLNLFMFSMLTLVLGNNYLMMFIGWEGVGLCSYLLIGYYFHKTKRRRRREEGIRREPRWRLGIVDRHHVDLYDRWLARIHEGWRNGPRRRQRPAHFHVSDPVFIEDRVGAVRRRNRKVRADSSVRLAAGRDGRSDSGQRTDPCRNDGDGGRLHGGAQQFHFQLAPQAMAVVAVIGALTALFAASIGLVQNDIKRVLAYSTVSQLGYMFLALGVGAFAAGMFHLMTHAFFKALLFLGSGSVIHAMHHEQDMRKMGALRKKIPITFWTMAHRNAGDRRNAVPGGFFLKG